MSNFSSALIQAIPIYLKLLTKHSELRWRIVKHVRELCRFDRYGLLRLILITYLLLYQRLLKKERTLIVFLFKSSRRRKRMKPIIFYYSFCLKDAHILIFIQMNSISFKLTNLIKLCRVNW